jgi:hypothetical protein
MMSTLKILMNLKYYTTFFSMFLAKKKSVSAQNGKQDEDITNDVQS